MPPSVLTDRIDHLVYATPDLDDTCAELEGLLGVRASVGGQHRGRGTRNALIAIGATCYLEIIGPDPEQASLSTPRWFEIDALTAPRLVTWAAAATNLPQLVVDAAGRSVQLGSVDHGRRQRPDGVVLTWQLTDPGAMLADGLVPFFIDWGASPHPASTAVTGPRLVELRGEHPDPQTASDLLATLGIAMSVDTAARASLVATLQTDSGLVHLR